MQVRGLFTYPLKSGRGRALTTAAVEPWGVLGDRRWALVGSDGVPITARTEPRLLAIASQTAELDAIAAGVRFSAPQLPPLEVAIPTGPVGVATVWGTPTPAIFAGTVADDWFAAAIGRTDVRLVWCPDPTVRELDPDRSQAGDSTAFADGFPVLLATEASLHQLNEWIAETAAERAEDPMTMEMSRFRPNIVLDGDRPFAEDEWTELVIGEGDHAVRLRSPSPCKRCVMTTVDPMTLAKGKEPLRTLARHRRGLGGTLFAINLVPDNPGTISVGDHVRVS